MGTGRLSRLPRKLAIELDEQEVPSRKLRKRSCVEASHPCIGTRGQSLEKVTDEEWHEFIDGILSTLFYMSKRVARHMIARGQGGVIINVSSINAYIIPNLTPGHKVPYCVAKEKTLMRSHVRKIVRT